jgi:hypothetical protein
MVFAIVFAAGLLLFKQAFSKKGGFGDAQQKKNFRESVRSHGNDFISGYFG